MIERERSGVRLVSARLTDGSAVYALYLRHQETGCRWCDRPAVTLNTVSGASACEFHDFDCTPPRERWFLFLEPEGEDAALRAFDLLVDAAHASAGLEVISREIDRLAAQGLRS